MGSTEMVKGEDEISSFEECAVGRTGKAVIRPVIGLPGHVSLELWARNGRGELQVIIEVISMRRERALEEIAAAQEEPEFNE